MNIFILSLTFVKKNIIIHIIKIHELNVCKSNMLKLLQT